MTIIWIAGRITDGETIHSGISGLNISRFDIHVYMYHFSFSHRVGGNRKRYQQSTNADQNSIETVFSIVICRQWGDKWQSKTLILLIFNLRSSINWRFRLPPTRCDSRYRLTGTLANSEDPDELPHYMGLHCLLRKKNCRDKNTYV